MSIQVVHIISNLSQINFGIWNAALFPGKWLAENTGIRTRVWVCEHNAGEAHIQIDYPITYLDQGTPLKQILKENSFAQNNTIFVSHGCWLTPTRIGYQLRKLDYAWLYVPHGMLEPWSMNQGKVKKSVYYFLYEGRFNRAASRVRAVSEKEQKNLAVKLRRSVDQIENGIQIVPYPKKKTEKLIFLFMARLHFKKGILPLVKAWKGVMGRDPRKKLIIAGPDEGELKNIQPFLGKNVKYAGPVYGEDKSDLLKNAHYYLLPSYSEGFPTSVLEAMGYGLIPLISKGCNFNAVFDQRLGHQVEPDTDSIAKVLRKLKAVKFDAALSLRNHEFIMKNFSEECIGRKLFTLYMEMIANTKTNST